MLLAAMRLLDRVRQPHSRADEVFDVRRRLVAQGAAAKVSAEELALAHELLRLRQELSAALRDVRACSGCAKGHSLPHGRWNGGQCCGGRTEGIFTDEELASLRLSGTTPTRLRAPDSDHAGCAFRGPQGCSLEVADRPNLCVRYVCRELEDELTEDGAIAHVKTLARALGDTFTRFSRLHAASAQNSHASEP